MQVFLHPICVTNTNTKLNVHHLFSSYLSFLCCIANKTSIFFLFINISFNNLLFHQLQHASVVQPHSSLNYLQMYIHFADIIMIVAM